MFAGIDAPREHLARVLTPLPGQCEGYVRVHTQGQALLFPVESVFQAPPPAILRRDLQVESAAVEQSLGLLGRLGAPQGKIGKCGHLAGGMG